MYISLLNSSSTRAKSIFMIPPSCNTNGFITISSLLLNLHLLLNPSLLFSAPLPQEVRNRKGTESNINWVIEKRSHHFDSIHRPMRAVFVIFIYTIITPPWSSSKSQILTATEGKRDHLLGRVHLYSSAPPISSPTVAALSRPLCENRTIIGLNPFTAWA